MSVLNTTATPSKADFDASGWADVLSNSPVSAVEHYSTLLFDRATVLSDEGRDEAALCLRLLAEACRPVLRPEDDDGPFVPLFTSGGRRSTLPEDFSDDELASLNSLLPDVQDPSLAARIHDLLWVCNRDHRAAREAVDLYVQSATTTRAVWSLRHR